jgi:hypothetical protein
MYCLSQLMRSFTKATLKTHLATVDQWANWDPGCVYYVFGDEFAYSPIVERVAVLSVFWLICVWLYWQKIFVRI